MIQRLLAATTGNVQYPETREADQFRALAGKIFSTRLADGCVVKNIAVTACEPRAGVTTTVAKLVESAAEQRRGIIALQYERSGNELASLLGTIDSDDQPLDESLEGNIIAPPGLISRTLCARTVLARIDRDLTAQSNGTLQAETVLQHLLRSPDIVIADLPPISDDTSTLAIAAKFDGVLLVVQAESTRRAQLRRAYEELRLMHANIVGVVFNNCGD